MADFKDRFGGVQPYDARPVMNRETGELLMGEKGPRYEALVDLSRLPQGEGMYGYFTYDSANVTDHRVSDVEIYKLGPGQTMRDVTLDNYCPVGCKQAEGQQADWLRAEVEYQGDKIARLPVALGPEAYEKVSELSRSEQAKQFLAESGHGFEQQYETYAASMVKQADAGFLLNSNSLPAEIKEFKEYGGIQWPQETMEQEQSSGSTRRLPDVPDTSDYGDDEKQFG